jgi:hypothetical protein
VKNKQWRAERPSKEEATAMIQVSADLSSTKPMAVEMNESVAFKIFLLSSTNQIF